MIEAIATLFAYNRWANRKILAAAAQLPLSDFKAQAGLSHASLCGTMAHILAAEVVWRQRCQAGSSPGSLLGAADFPDLEALQSAWEQEMAAWAIYVSGLSAEDLQADIHYRTTRGQEKQDRLWQLLLHVVNHGTQFRSEAAVTLTRLGHSPGDLDLLAYLREINP